MSRATCGLSYNLLHEPTFGRDAELSKLHISRYSGTSSQRILWMVLSLIIVVFDGMRARYGEYNGARLEK